jgi:predicted transcriptional regulator
VEKKSLMALLHLYFIFFLKFLFKKNYLTISQVEKNHAWLYNIFDRKMKQEKNHAWLYYIFDRKIKQEKNHESKMPRVAFFRLTN